MLDPLQSALPTRCVLDGEIVIVKNNRLDFEGLQLRLHPAASRVRLLSQQSPASIVFFDLLCEGDRDLCSQPFMSVTDGPFTEAKEVIGGLAILQANSKQEAIEHVKEFLKVAGDGECELRQLYEAPN